MTPSETRDKAIEAITKELNDQTMPINEVDIVFQVLATLGIWKELEKMNKLSEDILD